MRQSQLFSKTRREAPKDEVSLNAQLLIRAGYISKEMAGVYSYLPLGLRTLNKIAEIIRQEMNSIGGQEMLMTTLQDPEVWRTSDRWVEEKADPHKGLPWFKTKLVNDSELGIANTHEEALTNILLSHLSSYKDLPVYPYQFQTKFRNELRAKSGLLRGREFLMKDLYSYSKNEEEFKAFYEECAAAYLRIFERLGLGNLTFHTFASGGAFSKFSDEFQTVCQAGEDIIYIDREKNIAVNKEVYTDEILSELGLRKENLKEAKSIEVGNIFPLGTKYAQSLGLTFSNEQGTKHFPVMGSYGIGVGRAMGTVVEVMHDKTGIVWPLEISPYQVHLLSLPGGEQEAEQLYQALEQQGVEVLYDDRAAAPGEKLTDADLIGISWRVVVSEKTVKQNSAEVKKRSEKEMQLVELKDLAGFLSKNV